MSVWARLPVLDCVFGFLGVVEMCGVRGVCGDWKKCEIICPVLRLYYGCSFEKFVKIMDGINLGSVRKIYFHYEQEFDERWLEEIGMRMKEAEELDLSSCANFTSDSLLGLGNLASLVKLDLNWVNVSDEGLSGLPIGLKSLKLRFNECVFTMDSCWCVESFVRLKEL